MNYLFILKDKYYNKVCLILAIALFSKELIIAFDNIIYVLSMYNILLI